MNRRHLLTVMLGMGLLLAFAPPLWAERDDDQGEKRKRFESQQRSEQPRAPAKPARVVPERAPAGSTRDYRAEPVPPARKAVPPRTPQPAPPRVVVPERKPPPPGYVLDTRHRHNHYYPPRGHVETTLPLKHRVIVYRDVRYHYYDGIWYRPSGTRFIVVLPPIGLIVPILPPFYTLLWVGATPYYYAGGVYYTWYPEYQSYVVVEAPPAEQVRESPDGSDELFIYPKQGQSEEKQARDRYECHSWATSQTGFDPSQPGGGVTEAEHADKRADYRRAMKACLEARGYSVQ
jgi:hypothetical protein